MTAGRQLTLGIVAGIIITNLNFTVLAADNSAGSGVKDALEELFIIHQIVGNPTKESEVFAISSNYGVLKSEDAGLTWRMANHGLKSFTHHALAMAPTESPRLYAGGWAGGVSRSSDDGANWIEMNDGLGNTAVDAIAVDPGSPDRLYIVTSTQFYQTDAAGKGWAPFGQGLPPFPGPFQLKRLLLIPGPPKTLWYGNSHGLFHRAVDGSRWSEEEKFRNMTVTALAYDEKNRRLWIGTMNQGLLTRTDKAGEWRSIEMEKGLWITEIVIDRIDPRIIYVATRGKGVLKSIDGGKSWNPSNDGLQDQDIRSLAAHPLNNSLLIAGTSGSIFQSVDGGAHWTHAKPMPAFKMSELIEMLAIPPASTENRPAVPDAIAKCNGCHGWTDALLNRLHTYWRVPTNRRNWKETVGRMAERAHLTPEEESTLVNFLTTYSQRVSEGAAPSH
jgi:photosystem II stability/assembly factor-like uncharacterized protein